jgi:hypothetical protein
MPLPLVVPPPGVVVGMPPSGAGGDCGGAAHCTIATGFDEPEFWTRMYATPNWQLGKLRYVVPAALSREVS